MTEKIISPEQRITNIVRSLEYWSNAPNQPGRMWNIKAASKQLSEEWPQYLKGELDSLDTETSF